MAKAAKKNTASVRAAMAGSGDMMSLAQKISWWSLLAMVFIVPIAMSNWTFLGFRLPISYDQFDITKVFFQRVLGLIALSEWGWDILKRGGKIRRTPVDWLILAFLGWVAISMFFSSIDSWSESPVMTGFDVRAARLADSDNAVGISS